jgi:hypothetical protein
MSESNRNPKTFHEGKIKNPSPVHVSLDNAGPTSAAYEMVGVPHFSRSLREVGPFWFRSSARASHSRLLQNV